jgi:hypothetical protein
MRIAIGGAHRTGKTTVGTMLARSYGIKFEKSEISKANVWNDIGDKSAGFMTFAERTVLQTQLMTYLENKFNGFDTPSGFWVSDRTPFDVLAYLMANIDYTCSDLFYQVFDDLQTLACRIAKKYLDFIVIIQPGIVIPGDDDKEKTGKVYQSKIYKETLNAIIHSKTLELFPSEQVLVVPREILDAEERVTYIRQWVQWKEGT